MEKEEEKLGKNFDFIDSLKQKLEKEENREMRRIEEVLKLLEKRRKEEEEFISKELLELLKHPDWKVRKQAVLLLGKISNTASKQKLIELLKTEKDRVVKKTILLLLINEMEKKETGKIREIVYTAFQEEEFFYQLEIAKKIAEKKNQPLLDFCLDVLKSEDEKNHKVVLRILEDYLSRTGVWSREERETILLKIRKELENVSETVKHSVIPLLDFHDFQKAQEREEKSSEIIEQILKGENPVEKLIEALKHNDDYVREKAAEALGDLGDEKAIESLVEILNHDYEHVSYVRISAAKSLWWCFGEIIGLHSLLEQQDDETRLTTVLDLLDSGKLEEIEDPEVIKLLLKLASKEIDDIEAYRFMFGEKAIRTLIQVLNNTDTDWGEKKLAIRSLAQIEDMNKSNVKKVVDVLVQFLHSDDEYLSFEAAKTLRDNTILKKNLNNEELSRKEDVLSRVEW